MAERKDRVLHSHEIPDYDNKPEWGGTIIEITQYEEQRPKVSLKRYYFDKTTGEKRISGYIDLPPGSVPKITEAMSKAAAWIERNHPKPQRSNCA